MGFQFSGFFAKGCEVEEIKKVETVDAVVKVEKPFSGVGINVPEYASKDPTTDELNKLASEIGLTDEIEWLFMVYECFGGQIDYLFGFIHSPKGCAGPVTESSLEKVEDAYVEFMGRFGLSKEQCMNFEPFERGFFE